MISVIIPTYKNKEGLVKNLENNLPYLKRCEVIVINDDPEESIKDDLKDFNIFLVENRKNLGFGGAVNRGVESAKYPFIMLLNSDVTLHDKSYEKAFAYFKKSKNLFAVSFAQKEKNGNIVGKNMFYWKRGLFFHKKAKDRIFGKNGWAEGGACLIDKEKFIALGGFDPIYKPFYWEDIDLSYRAWKVGYEIYFDPNILVTHHHESTIGKYFDKSYVKKIAYRNQLIFIRKNIADKNLRLSYLLFLPWNLVYYMARNEWNFIGGYIDSFLKRGKQKGLFIKTDRQILKLFN